LSFESLGRIAAFSFFGADDLSKFHAVNCVGPKQTLRKSAVWWSSSNRSMQRSSIQQLAHDGCSSEVVYVMIGNLWARMCNMHFDAAVYEANM
jgi:hypothetical protein